MAKKKVLALPDPAMESRKDLELFMLRARSLRIQLINVTPGLKLDVMSYLMKQFRRFGSYGATTRRVVINAKNNDECEAGGGIVRLTDQP